ncbi:MAG TPA: trypsin-like peptidase domain-containing protein [Phycisphaerae bacterium]|nr:trypsin-like peptidase domain-containing protein [Phycisphaerae bacterium]HNU45704.1 trypsin-like peptidase domain-containing protein [Phycisphaerae bacterium]
MRSHRYRRWVLPCALAAAALGTTGRAFAADEMKPAVEKRVKGATVMVATAVSEREKGDRPVGFGSGYFINRTGLLMTNNHVADIAHQRSDLEKQRTYYNAGRVTWRVIVDSGTDKQKIWECIDVYGNDEADQHLLQAIDEDGNKLETPNFLPLLPESRLHESMQVWNFGFPGADSQRMTGQQHPEVTVTTGHIRQLPRTPGGRVRMVYVDAQARPGNSGGPSVNVDGYLVGTVTLMAKPEDRDTTANDTGLVPAKITREMVRNAYALGKIHPGTDFTPFMSILTNEDGKVILPEFPRLRDGEAVYFPDGDRHFGKITTQNITWNSPLGAFEVPLDVVAYVMSHADGCNLYLEGGNRISATAVGSSFKFEPKGGQLTDLEFDDVGVVAFRTSDRKIESLPPKVLEFDADQAHLVLTDVQGKAKLESRAGTLEVDLESVARVERRADGQRLVKLRDGRRITGEFTSDPIQATIAAVNLPIRFSLGDIDQLTIEVVRYGLGSVAGLGLPGVLKDGDWDIQEVVKRIESDDLPAARTKFDALMEPDSLRRYPNVKKDHLALLEGVIALREGKYEDAAKGLRKASKARNNNIVAYAEACSAVLKRFPENTFNGKPLSDTNAFAQAGMVHADERIKEIRIYLKDARLLGTQGKLRGEYVSPSARGATRVALYDDTKKGVFTRILADARKYEQSMKIASVLGGVEADDELIRLWDFASRACLREYMRAQVDMQELTQDRAGGPRPGSGAGAQARIQREAEALRKDAEKAYETYWEFQRNLYEYGFRIEDPDIQKQREDQEQRGKTEEPSTEPGP